MLEDNIRFKWMDIKDFEKDKEKIRNMYKECFLQYHYPYMKLEDTYFIEKINGLKEYLLSNQANILAIYSKDELIGFWWIYYSTFINKKRCHINCAYICNEYRKKGLSMQAYKIIIEKAKKDDCDEIATMYAKFNSPMEKSLQKNDFEITRIECVKKIK